MSDEMLDALDQVYANASRLVAGVGADQWTEATPCSEWNVTELVNHMTGTTNLLYATASRSEPSGPADDDNLGDDPVGSFAAAAVRTTAAWREPGATDGMVSVPAEMPAMAALGVNILDIGTHSWDLATATGQDHGLTPELIALIDQWNRQVVSDDVRAGGGFGAELEPASDEPLTTMLAYVGRRG